MLALLKAVLQRKLVVPAGHRRAMRLAAVKVRQHLSKKTQQPWLLDAAHEAVAKASNKQVEGCCKTCDRILILKRLLPWCFYTNFLRRIQLS